MLLISCITSIDVAAQNVQDRPENDTTATSIRMRYPEISIRTPQLFPAVNQGMYLDARNSIVLPVSRMLPANLRNYRNIEETDSTGHLITVAPKFYDTPLAIPITMDLDEYYQYRREYNQRRLLVERFASERRAGGLDAMSNRGLELVGADIAGQRVALRISGNVNINARASREDKNLVTTSYLSEPRTNIIFNQKQNFSIEGNIGDRINVLVDYNSERDFQFENDVSINYVGDEDDIIQRIDAGNISLSLPGTQLVTFSPTSQGLFGVRTDLKIGPIDMTTVASIEQGKKQRMSFQGGSTTQEYEVFDYNYVKNKYFFLDEYYRSNFYPLVQGTNERLIPDQNQIIEDIELFKSVVGTSFESGNIIKGKAWVDPNDTLSAADQAREADFKILEQDVDYTVNKDAGFIRLNTSLQDNELLAVSFVTLGGDTTGDMVFNQFDSSRVNLKMIRVDNPSPSKPTWDLMFKNVYSLGTINLEADGFEFEIVDTYTNQNDNINDQGVNWLEVFGIDRFNEQDQAVPDGRVDLTNIIDLQRGEIFFPYLEPFRASREAAEAGVDTVPGLYNPNLSTELSQSEMYEGSYRVNSNMQEESAFKLVAKYSQQSANIKLDGFNIIDGSEEVRLNGSLLQKGVDYNIDYFLGQVTMLNEDALKPGADLQISYESNEVFQLDKKVVVGGRAEYSFGENSFLAATGMYYSKSSIDDKVRIDQEPFRNFVWDVNGRFDQNVNFITRALDWMPLIRTEAPSRIQVEGEYAQVMPNPNTQDSDLDDDGVAYIDDFEGSKKTTTLTVGRGAWTPASIPKGPNGESLGYNERNRGFLYWFNPRAGIATQAIWPNRETSFRNETNTTQILNVVLNPKRAIGDTDPATIGTQADSIWGGFMRALPSSYRDQTESKYIEIWLNGTSGKIHIDLGLVSEDVNGNRRLDTEDIERNGWANDLIDEGEDIGIDRQVDEDEVGIYGWFDPDTLTIDSPPGLFEKYGLQVGDPSGDNYNYEIGNRSSFRWINGTEGNARLENGKIPDTEDINRNKIQDLTESFLRYTIPVDTTENPYFVNGTFHDEAKTFPTGWKLYRIPLTDFVQEQSSPDASLEDIQFARIWFSDFDFNGGDEDTLSIAQMEIVGNEWIETGIKDIVNDTTITDSSFAVTVVNNEDNQAIYSPPPGVRGEYDRVNQITSKEQSLVLDMQNFVPWTESSAARIFHQSQEMSLVNYKFMKLFIHGDNNLNSTGDHLEFFFRMGRDEENYYEYSTQLEPGWQNMELDLTFLAQIKAVDSLATQSGSPYPLRDPRGYIFFDDNRITFQDTVSEKRFELTVNGRPSLTKVKQMEAGVRNYTGEDYREWRKTGAVDMSWAPYYGQVWINELRVTGVDRDGGQAMRGRASIDFADVMSVSVSADRTDADFHRVDSQWGNNMNSEAFDVNLNLNLDKFLPSSWRMRIPVRGRYNERNQIPKYIPGSDVLTNRLRESLGSQAAEDTIRTLETYSFQRSYGTSISRGGRSDHWVPRYTLDAMRLSYDYAESYLRNSTQRFSMNSRNTIQGSYQVQFPKTNGIGLFSVLEGVPLLGKMLSDMRLSYLPTNLNASAVITETSDFRAYRNPASSPQDRYNQTLQRNFSTGYNPFNAVGLTFNKRMDSNISAYRGEDRWDVIQFMRPGIITDVSENYGLNYSPSFSNWLRPTFRYQANYTFSDDLNENVEGINTAYAQQSSVNLTLDLRQLRTALGGSDTNQRPNTGTRGRPAGRPQTRPGTGGGRPVPGREGEEETEDDEQEEEESGPSIGEALGAVIGKIQPINLRYSNSRRGRHSRLTDIPDFKYRLGLQRDAEVPVVPAYEGQAGISGIDESNDFGVNTGINLTQNINASVNFSHSVSHSIQPNQTTKTVQRDYFLTQFSQEDINLSDSGIKGIPLPGWSVRWSGLEKLPFFSAFARSVTLTHNYSGRYSTNFRNGEQQRASYVQNLQPLAGVRINLKGDIGMDASYGTVKSLTHSFNGGEARDLSNSRNITFSADYRRRSGLRLPIPFLRNLNMDNEITFNFTFNYNKSQQYKDIGGSSFDLVDENYSWEVQPKIDYKFTNRVTGGIFYKYGQRFSARINNEGKPTTVRDFGLTINIQIRG